MARLLDKMTGIKLCADVNRRVLRRQQMDEVSQYLAKGYTVRDIAKMMFPEINGETKVYRLIRRLSEKAKKSSELNYEFYLNQKDAQYNVIMKECWIAYEASKKNHKGEPCQPNVVYLDRILACLEAMRKLRGLDKQVNEPKQENKGLNWDSLTAGRQLSSITVSLNGNEVAKSNNQNAAMVLKDEIDERIEELERRAEKRASMLDDDAPSAKVGDTNKGAQSNKVIVVKAVRPTED